jgi:hypothetical protein
MPVHLLEKLGEKKTSDCSAVKNNEKQGTLSQKSKRNLAQKIHDWVITL